MTIRVDFVRPALGRPLGLAGMRKTVADADRQLGLSLRFDRLTIAFNRLDEMRELKRRYMGIDRPTDVLSFPADSSVPDFSPDGSRPLGEMVLCPDFLTPDYRTAALPRRARQLVLHSILHLLGFDHEADAGEMRRLEVKLRRRMGIG